MHDLRVMRYGFLLLDNFSLIALGAAVDPLRIANMVVGRRVYDYQLIAAHGDVVQSSDGIRVVPDVALTDNATFDAVFVVGPNPIPCKGIGAVIDWLRRQAGNGAALGGLDTGSYFLARAGLLNGYRCTIHWEDQDVLIEQFPKLTVSNRLYEVDRDRFTCSGGVAPLDLMVHLLAMPPGSQALAARVLELLVAERRSREYRQRTSLRQYIGAEHMKLDEALQIMESNVEETLSVAEIASHLRVSQRQLQRWFHERLGKTPAQAYLEIRLLRARQLLYRTAAPLEEVCSRTGFTSTTHFATRYKAQFQISPMADRRRYQNAL
ncbi:TPA: GlxA family transcriptional regulator [Burkholderia vietnamiensis]|nr:GlxA family transcriptional regulator [Burkholderia contaminans]MBR8016401.1 GlxA family transcriptional regulator [Burkholderia vietnamiensis]OQD23082.1 AraC family transcriptional regulator [Burkholderia cenocepacia]PRE00587.1 GlxA family transcriptional regulator [Burkholderia multivorans]MBR8165345.1 GlxA family transcriptional regulator [Burkholderia vietnamiensis]